MAQAQSPELFGEDAPADSTLTQDQLRAKNPLFSVFQLELGRRSAVVGYTLASDTNRVNDLLSQPAAREALGSDLRSCGKPSLPPTWLNPPSRTRQAKARRS